MRVCVCVRVGGERKWPENRDRVPCVSSTIMATHDGRFPFEAWLAYIYGTEKTRLVGNRESFTIRDV